MKLIPLLMLAVITSPAAALADENACLKKLCSSILQSDCWLSATAPMCDAKNDLCLSIPDAANVQLFRKVGTRWYAHTQYGTGWVTDKYLMTHGKRC